MSLRRFLAAVLLLIMTALAVVVYLFPNTSDYYRDNYGWNGLSSVASVTDISVTGIIDGTSSPRMIILVPNTSPSPDALTRLEEFVSDGGYLVLADDFGTGNLILQHLGLNARFSNQPLLDPVVCYQNRVFPIVRRFTHHPLTAGLSEIVLNHPTTLTGIDDAGTLAWSSSFSFQDDNGNGVKDNSEPFGPFPIMAEVKFGDGRILLVSDPGIFINANYAIKDNARLLDNLSSVTGGIINFDASLLSPSPLTVSKDYLASGRDWLKSPVGTIIIVIMGLALVWLLWQPGSNSKKSEKSEG